MSEVRSDNAWVDKTTDKQRDYIDIGTFNPNISTISTLSGAWNNLYCITIGCHRIVPYWRCRYPEFFRRPVLLPISTYFSNETIRDNSMTADGYTVQIS